MGNRRLVKYISDLTSKEKIIITDVMKKYDFQVYDILKARSAYKLVTSKGDFCLKKMKHGERRILNGSVLAYSLRQKGFTNTAEYIKTKNGMTYIKSNKHLFYLTTWINGRECSMDCIEEVVKCTELLAEFHLAARNIKSKNLTFNERSFNSPILYSNYINDFDRYKKIIKSMKLKNVFDELYLKYVDYYCSRAFQALNLISESKYYKMLEEAKKNKTICHNSFYYQNIMKTEEKYYIIDLDSVIIDVQIVDLAKFIRRIMYRKEFGWKFNFAKSMIEAYSSINKISKDELKLILAYIIFPHKFWKIGRKKYKKRKSFSENKFNHKLNRIINYKEKEEEFFIDFIKYMNNYHERRE